MSLSIIIPAYNYADLLPRAVGSAMTQLAEDDELIVINDGSTDHTTTVLHELKQQFPALQVYTQTNQGLAATRNQGIQKSKGKDLLFLDADDELCLGAVKHIKTKLAGLPENYGLLSGGHLSIQANGRARFCGPGSIEKDSYTNVRSYLIDKKIRLSNGCTIFNRKVFERYLYNEKFRTSEDIPLFAYTLALFPCFTFNEPLIKVHKHSGSLRHQIQWLPRNQYELVNEVFKPEYMPFQDLKKLFLVQHCLSLSRSYFLAKDYCFAWQYYQSALFADWRVLAKLSYTRKAVKALLYKYRG